MSARRAPSPEIDPLYCAQDVMALLGCSRSYVQDHRAELGGRKLAGLLRFPRSSVVAFIAASTVVPEPAEQSEPTPISPSIDTMGLPEKNPVTGEHWPWNQATEGRVR